MNKLAILFIAICLLASCSNSTQKATNNESNKQEIEAVETFKTVNDLLLNAEKELDKTIQLTAVVTHTCKHSGKRCFLADTDSDETIRVESGGKINGFNRELVGSTIKVTGVLKERRLTKEYIDQWEESVKEKAVQEDGSAETCEAENNNISKMRAWMKEHGKDYYSIFFINGIDYDIVE